MSPTDVIRQQISLIEGAINTERGMLDRLERDLTQTRVKLQVLEEERKAYVAALHKLDPGYVE